MTLFKKVLYIDTETTGLQPGVHGLIHVAAIMEIGGDVAGTFEVKCQPHPGAVVDAAALAVSGTSEEEMLQRTTSSDGAREFQRWLDTFISKFDKNDKAYPAGYNVSFDLQFVDAWLKHHGNQYGSGSYQNWRMLDPLYLLRIWDFTGRINLADYKLGTVCQHFAIPLQAHDAMHDITATRELLLAMLKTESEER